jgi:hypothetical protein
VSYRDACGRFPKDAGIAGGTLCPFCKRRLKMGPVDAHRCERRVISISVDKAQLKRIDALADKAGMNRSQFMAASSLASDLSPEERQLLALVRGMRP